LHDLLQNVQIDRAERSAARLLDVDAGGARVNGVSRLAAISHADQ